MKLRKVISNAIASDPAYFNEGILGKKNYDYQKYIEQPNTWGGSVELNIFSDYFKTEIMAYDVTRKRGNCFGEAKYSQRVYLLYDGIHYDVLVWNLVPSSPQSDFDVTVFNAKDSAIEREFIKVMEKEHASGKYVDEYNYTLQCLQCGQKFVGNSAAVAHAKATQHDQFGQASN
uniref:Ubiquitin thioesterase OTU n=1 Tax=Arcella intermedia TaxID=1963864 RepID=A0A6B2LIS6_9EUKA